MKNSIIAILGIFLLYSSCQSKKVSINFQQTECKNLLLKNATYSLEKPSCVNGQKQSNIQNTIRIKVDHNNKQACLEFFHIDAQFLRSDGSAISGVSYKSEYKYTDPEVTLTSSYIEIDFMYTLATTQDADDLSTIKIDLRLENELKDVSKFFTLTVPLGCVLSSTVAGNYQMVQTVYVPNNGSNTVTVGFRDYSQIDGDIITAYFNGTMIANNLTLTGSFQNYTVTLNSGSNQLVVIAINEGTSSPNTCEVRVDNQTGIDLTPGLNTGQGVNIVF